MGILRSGYLLMEGSPSELMSQYEEKSLESLYTNIYSLKIRKDPTIHEKKSIHEHPRVRLERLPETKSEGFIYIEDESDNKPSINSRELLKGRRKIKCTYLKRFLKILPNCKRVGRVLLRDILVTGRSYIWLLTIFLVPLLLVAIFNCTVGQQPTNLDVGVVNLEASESECQKNANKYISCQVLEQIDTHVINIIYYKNYEKAEDDAFKLKVSAILIVGEKFSNQLLRTMANIALNSVEAENPDTAQLILRLDMTSRILANTIEHEIKRAVEKYLEMATSDTKIQNATIGYPMRVGI